MPKAWRYQNWRISRTLIAPSSGYNCRLEVCGGACCGGGIWTDADQAQAILQHAPAIARHLPGERQDPKRWFSGEAMDHPDFASGLGLATAVLPRLDGSDRRACIFALADHTCAVERASVDLGLAWPGLKPFDCATFPVLRSEGGVAWDRTTEAIPTQADCQRPLPTQPGPPFHTVFRREIELAIGRQGLEFVEQRFHARRKKA